MVKLKMKSENLVDANVEKIASLFPNCVTESMEDGKLAKKVDFDLLRQELSNVLVEGRDERYRLDWAGKRQAILTANSPITKTLRPCREESVNFDTTENLYIEGDNLDVLKLLHETYLNKVKMIYIDPPYNTGKDLLYKNNYSQTEDEVNREHQDEEGKKLFVNRDTTGKLHTNWVNMMYPLLKLAKDLLTDDGCIVIAIDHWELHNLIKICDEIFSEVNRLGIVTVVHKPEGRNQERFFATSNEFALFYAKDSRIFDFEKVIIDEDKAKEYSRQDSRGRYKLNSMIAKNRGRQGYDKNLRENNPKNYYPIYISKDLQTISLVQVEDYHVILPNTSTQERTWRFIKETMQQLIDNKELVVEFVGNELQLFEKYREDKGQLIKTHWIDSRYNAAVHGTSVINSLFGESTFDFPKSIYLMEDIVKLCTKGGDTVLDFFAGSSTTAHAVMNVNANSNYDENVHFIMVQLNLDLNESLKVVIGEAKQSTESAIKYLTKIGKPAILSEIGKERIRRAGNKIAEENRMTAPNLDIGFRVLKLADSNMKDVFYNPKEYNQSMLLGLDSSIKEDRTAEDLLFQVMLDKGVSLSSKIEKKTTANGEQSYYIVGETGFGIIDLICCLDKKVNTDAVKEIAKLQPECCVFLDSGIENDATRTNIQQIFTTYSPKTKVEVV